jgi:CRISPR-associated protein Cmr4
MYKITRPLFLTCRTPLHAGTGSDLGYIDLPIQREKHTGFPKVEASSLKGCLKEAFELNSKLLIAPFSTTKKVNDDNNISLSFGPKNGDDHASALGFTDARLLLFPVKSLKGIFAWVTCPRVLEKFKDELTLCCLSENDKVKALSLANLPKEKTVSSLDVLGIGTAANQKVVLEEYAFTFKVEEATTNFASALGIILELTDLNKRLVVLSNDEFTDFVKLHTEVITRVRIGDNGTAEGGALFNEEFLPTESVLYSLVLASPIFQETGKKGIFVKTNGKEEYENLLEYFKQGIPKVFQLGANATLGKGLISSNTNLF